MAKPFGVISDQHFHGWTAFSEVNAEGLNSRLQFQLAELRRCAVEVRAAGGDTIINAGDTFHVRGSLAPSVLNPVLDLHKELIDEGFQIVILAGNHDLELRQATRISSAVTALEGIGCQVVNAPTAVEKSLMIPWIPNVAELKATIEREAIALAGFGISLGEIDLILHAPIDGVIPGLPDHGLDPAYLQSLGFNRVFSGHYHHHKDFGGGVYSIGASTHQTWSDVGTKAGFLLVTDEKVTWRKSLAPEFVEIYSTTDPTDIPLLVDGNYVKCRLDTKKASAVDEVRQFLMDSGARGVTVIAEAAATAPARGTAVVRKSATLAESLVDFVNAGTFDNKAQLSAVCAGILTEAESVE
ncbi:metallophosphoesterase [Cupriavidus campinensis]|uniref:Serine/threonine protein phosphatase n=1 Tax=Cupriavidus campinensis TaxID=151783 RepID=A0ABY3ESQ2_9BURK|nr:metallophosphoesterase [Cupriavidus campinensis]TSP14004.1 serine/threonine protein phosphatase [Cupriavidus campinensis]